MNPFLSPLLPSPLLLQCRPRDFTFWTWFTPWLQKEVQAADVPARERNVDAFIAALDSVEKKFDTFLELFQDVPSEL